MERKRTGPPSKLTPADMEVITSLHAEGWTLGDLAEYFKVSKATIRRAAQKHGLCLFFKRGRRARGREERGIATRIGKTCIYREPDLYDPHKRLAAAVLAPLCDTLRHHAHRPPAAVRIARRTLLSDTPAIAASLELLDCYGDVGALLDQAP